MLLFDSGPFVYLMNDLRQKFPLKASRMIDSASGGYAISAATIFEVRILARRRSWKETLRYELVDLNDVCRDRGISVLPVTGEIFNRAADYPLDYRDHFDKLIAATAEIHGLDLISEDTEIDRLGTGWNRVW